MADLPRLAEVEPRFRKKLGYLPTGDEFDRAEEMLDEASELIRDEAEMTWVDGAGDLEDVPARVQGICVTAAYRAFTNPEGLTQRVIGDSTKGYDRTGREGGELVYLTDEEKRAIRRAAGGNAFRAVTLTSPYSGDGEVAEVLWP